MNGEEEAGGCAFLCSRRHRSLLHRVKRLCHRPEAALILSDSLARLFLTTRSCLNRRRKTNTVS